MHHDFANHQHLALDGLKAFFAATVQRLPKAKYLEALASFLPDDFFTDAKTAAQRWAIIKNNCKNSAFKKVIYSDWRFSPQFLRHMATQAQAIVDLENLNVLKKLNHYNHIRHLILPTATNNEVPLLEQQAIVLVLIDCFRESKYVEEGLDLEQEVDSQNQFTDANIRDYYRSHKKSIRAKALEELLLHQQSAPTSILNYYLNQKRTAVTTAPASNAPVVQTSFLQWRYVAPIVCTIAAGAMIAYCSNRSM
jgi:hypothetical protein